MDEGGFSVVLELERLRGAVNEGFATLNGRLDGHQQRTTQNEADVDKLEQKVDDASRSLEARVTTLERKIWMAAGAAAILSGGGVAGVLQVMGAR